MKRFTFSTTLVALLALSLALQAGTTFAAIEKWYYFGFDETLKPWTSGSSEPTGDDNTLTLGFDPVMTRMQPGSGNGYAILTNNYGSTVWMKAAFTPGAKKLRVEFLARNVQDCGACIPIVYAGTSEPRYPSEFVTDYKGIGESWLYHGFDLTVKADQLDNISNKIVVAVGFTNLDIEAYCPIEQRVAIDNLHITIFD